MQDTNTTVIQSPLQRLKAAMDASRKYLRDLKHLAYEGKDSSIGLIRRFRQKTNGNSVGLLSGNSAISALAISTIFENSALSIKALMDGIKTFVAAVPAWAPPSPINLSERFTMKASAEVVEALAQDEVAFERHLSNEFNAVFDAKPDFIGPHAEFETIHKTLQSTYQLRQSFDAHGGVSYLHLADKVAHLTAQPAFAAKAANTSEPVAATQSVAVFYAAANNIATPIAPQLAIQPPSLRPATPAFAV